MVMLSENLKYPGLKRILIPVIAFILTFLTELYIVILEHSEALFNYDYLTFTKASISFFSIKHLILIYLIYLIIVGILFNENLKKSVLNFLYKYRFLIGIGIIIISVIFEIHGSSIAQMNISNLAHSPLLGISRGFRSDEFCVNTMFAFSQYFNGFDYFSFIPRATQTDMFIVYGQPIWNLLTLYRPFLLGYLFLSPAKGLSFFWISRLVALFLVSFEMGRLITKDNKRLSLAYAILLTFSSFVQFWFAINALVEMLVFLQLFVLLLNYYMTTDNYLKRSIATIFLIISSGGFCLTLYPAWEIPLLYVFLASTIFVIHKNWSDFNFTKKDLALILTFIFALLLTAYYIYSKSYGTISLTMNTSYPGSRMFYGGLDPRFLFDYLGSIFYPLMPESTSAFVYTYSFIFTFFPAGIILFCIVQFYQKENDVFLYLLMIVYLILVGYYVFNDPEIIGKITLLSKSFNERLLQIATFAELLILIRSMALVKKVNIKKNYKLILAFLLAGMCVFILNSFHPNRYNIFMIFIALITLTISMFFIFNIHSKKAQKGFLICVIAISFCTGALVNPVESGTDIYFEQPIIKEASQIVSNNPNATWIVEGNIFINEVIGVGAPTLNSVHTYPSLNLWKKLDPNNESWDIYNRYAHIPLVLQDNAPTKVVLPDENNGALIVLYLNTSDLEELNVTYVLTTNYMEHFSNENMTFTKTYEDLNGNRIYKITYT
jgi:hypothetical protein